MRNRIRDERLRRGMSQADIAKALGVSRQTVISIESGRYSPSLPLAFRIAQLFGTKVDEMFFPEEGAGNEELRLSTVAETANDGDSWRRRRDGGGTRLRMGASDTDRGYFHRCGGL